MQKQDPSKPIWVEKPQLKFKQAKKDYSIFVATPVHSDVSLHYTQALLEFQTYCHYKGINVMFQLLKSSLVTQGRNLCVSYFLKSKYSHLLFIDSDIDFEAKDIEKLVDLDRDIISIPYPLKTMNWDRALSNMDNGKIKNNQNLQQALNMYPIRLVDEKDVKVYPDRTVEVTHAPTGCMLIKRTVFEKMMKELSHLKIKQETIINGKLKETEFLYNFFDTEFDSKEHTYMGEDFAFCRKWRSLGGKCWAYIDSKIAHVGEHQYVGKFSDELIIK